MFEHSLSHFKTLLAYLDPGTGGLIVQAVIGFFCAIGFTAKLWWGKVKGFFSGNKGNDDKKSDSPDAE